MSLVTPLTKDANEEIAELAIFSNETLGFYPNSAFIMQRHPASVNKIGL